jgi:hypothetical protein
VRNPINIDYTHSRAICREIGERLQQYLRSAETELPARVRKLVQRLYELEDRSRGTAIDTMTAEEDRATQS